MDGLFLTLVGKPKLNPPKLITIVAENFTYLEDQARFLRAILAIPAVKQLPLDNLSKRLIQFGPIYCEIETQLRKEKWSINQYENFDESICDMIEKDLDEVRNRSILFFNDVSRLELSSKLQNETNRLLQLSEKLKREKGHFIVMLYQDSIPNKKSKFLSHLEYLSDGFVRASSHKNCYLLSIWYQTIPEVKTLIPAKIDTNYYTCKIGRSYWSSDLLCFYDRKKVSKDFDPDAENLVENPSSGDKHSPKEEEEEVVEVDEKVDEVENTLPYIKAQNPEHSRIFYYPDKEDDFDEDDPDADLNI